MFRSFILLTIAVVCTYATEGVYRPSFIRGRINYDGQYLPIPLNSKVVVSLEDISLTDVPSTLIGSTTIFNPIGFPISYKLQYDLSKIGLNHRYSILAKIVGPDGKVLFWNAVRPSFELLRERSPTIDIRAIPAHRNQNEIVVRKIKSICLLPAEVSYCRMSIPRYFYNSITRRCEKFFWGGCEGNGNNFRTVADCYRTCITI